MNYKEQAADQIGPQSLYPSKAEHQAAIDERTEQLKVFKEKGLSGHGRTPATPVKDHRTSKDYRSPLVAEHMQAEPGPAVRAGLLATEEPIDQGAFDDEFAVVEVAPVMEALMDEVVPITQQLMQQPPMPQQPMQPPMPQQMPMQQAMPQMPPQAMPQQMPMQQPMPQQQVPQPARDWWSML